MKKVGRPKKIITVVHSKDNVAEILAKEGVCFLKGFGKFELRTIQKREYRDRWTGKIVTIKKHKRVGFIADKKLEDKVMELCKTKTLK